MKQRVHNEWFTLSSREAARAVARRPRFSLGASMSMPNGEPSSISALLVIRSASSLGSLRTCRDAVVPLASGKELR